MKKHFFLLVCFFSFLLSSCGRTNGNSDTDIEMAYLTYNNFRTDGMSEEEAIRHLEQEIKGVLMQADDISDAEVSILRTDSGYEVNVNLTCNTVEDLFLKSWAEDLISIALANEEGLVININ